MEAIRISSKVWRQIGLGTCVILFGAVAWSSCSEPELPADVEQAMAALPAKIDYNQHVKSILSDRCYACHGPDENKQKGDLRLDLPAWTCRWLPTKRRPRVAG
jgi:mono/diheme cytochrome c family protein